MLEGSSHCRWCYPWAGDLGVPGMYKEANLVSYEKQASEEHSFMVPSTVPVWVLALTFPSAELWSESHKPSKASSPQTVFSHGILSQQQKIWHNIYLFFVFLLRQVLSSVWVLLIRVRLIDQWALGICLFICHKHWNLKCRAPCLILKMWVLRIELRNSYLQGKCYTDWTISPDMVAKWLSWEQMFIHHIFTLSLPKWCFFTQ